MGWWGGGRGVLPRGTCLERSDGSVGSNEGRGATIQDKVVLQRWTRNHRTEKGNKVNASNRRGEEGRCPPGTACFLQPGPSQVVQAVLPRERTGERGGWHEQDMQSAAHQPACDGLNDLFHKATL